MGTHVEGIPGLHELRILDGPNLYFARPAVKLTLDVHGLQAMPARTVVRIARQVGLRDAAAGSANSERRVRLLARAAAQLTRRIAQASGARLAVRGRPGNEPGQVVVAFPWRRRQAATELAKAVARSLHQLGEGSTLRALLPSAVAAIEAAGDGEASAVAEPSIPVVAVTGTNGKTTTVRLIAHIARSAGLSTAYTSTDGVYRDGQLVEAGDYSGFGGAGLALSQPGVQMVVLEVARGGILLRGIGTAHTDVSVVTNVSADHLDQYGIRTLDQLAEVKATITRITRLKGWNVLNADDPRVLAMRQRGRAQTWLFSLDQDHPGIRGVLAEGGRATTIVDGHICVIVPGQRMRRLIPLENVPMTLAGISGMNIRNALAATSAALGAGVPVEAVVRGLHTFTLDAENNPGRANLFQLHDRLVVVDYAHNEEGMRGLVDIVRGLRPPGARVWLTFCSAGDRTNPILHRLAYTAARGADHVALAELHRYLRGRDPQDLLRRLQDGIIDGSGKEAPVFPDELHALRWMLEQSGPGDVVAVTALGQRPEIFGLLKDEGAQPLSSVEVRRLVRRSRGAGSIRKPGRTEHKLA
jgi:cyanophycin synthetase